MRRVVDTATIVIHPISCYLMGRIGNAEGKAAEIYGYGDHVFRTQEEFVGGDRSRGIILGINCRCERHTSSYGRQLLDKLIRAIEA
jgi:hypothetical protein